MAALRDGEGGCCWDCHARWEERNVFPSLPPWLRALMRADHERIRALPKSCREAWIQHHAQIEESYCRQFLPAHLQRELEKQHDGH